MRQLKFWLIIDEETLQVYSAWWEFKPMPNKGCKAIEITLQIGSTIPDSIVLTSIPEEVN